MVIALHLCRQPSTPLLVSYGTVGTHGEADTKLIFFFPTFICSCRVINSEQYVLSAVGAAGKHLTLR